MEKLLKLRNQTAISHLDINHKFMRSNFILITPSALFLLASPFLAALPGSAVAFNLIGAFFAVPAIMWGSGKYKYIGLAIFIILQSLAMLDLRHLYK